MSQALTRALRAALEGGPAVLADPGRRRAARVRPGAGEARPIDRRRHRPRGRDERLDGCPEARALSADALRRERRRDATPRSAVPGSGCSRCPRHYIAGAQVLVRVDRRGHRTRGARASSSIRRRSPRHPRSSMPHGAALHLARARAARPPVDAAEDDRQSPTRCTRSTRCSSAGRRSRRADRRRADAARRARHPHLRVERDGGRMRLRRACRSAATRVRIVDGARRAVGPMLADGYLGDPERTAAAFRPTPTARAGIARATSARSRTTARCASPAGPTT